MATTKLRLLRQKKNISILRLSELSGVSFEKVRQLDRVYRVETTSVEIKEKIAFAIGRKVFEIFPASQIEKGEAHLETLRTFYPDLKLKSEKKAIQILAKLTPDDLQHVYVSGMDKEQVKRLLRKFGIEIEK